MKQSVLKVGFLTVLVAAMVVGFMSLAAAPAEAVMCARLPGCTFEGIEHFQNACCCTYTCNGETEYGECFDTP